MVVYMATSPSGKSYIGKTKQSLAKRISNHRTKAARGKPGKFMNAVRKYGVDNFIWQILETTFDYDTLNALEVWNINKYDCIDNGYNIHIGGDFKYSCIQYIDEINNNLYNHYKKEVIWDRILD